MFVCVCLLIVFIYFSIYLTMCPATKARRDASKDLNIALDIPTVCWDQWLLFLFLMVTQRPDQSFGSYLMVVEHSQARGSHIKKAERKETKPLGECHRVDEIASRNEISKTLAVRRVYAAPVSPVCNGWYLAVGNADAKRPSPQCNEPCVYSRLPWSLAMTLFWQRSMRQQSQSITLVDLHHMSFTGSRTWQRPWFHRVFWLMA